MTNLKPVIDAIAAEILTLAHTIMDSSEMGLRDSVLKKDMDVVVRSYDQPVVVELLLNDYVEYIDSGRAPRQGKQPPIDALRDWALARGIATDNSTLFLIARAIWRNGYASRPILATLEEEIEDRWENEWSDLIADELMKSFEELIN